MDGTEGCGTARVRAGSDGADGIEDPDVGYSTTQQGIERTPIGGGIRKTENLMPHEHCRHSAWKPTQYTRRWMICEEHSRKTIQKSVLLELLTYSLGPLWRI